MNGFRAALLAAAIVAGSAPAAASRLTADFVRAVSAEDIGAFAPLADDALQLRERDWIAVARWVDRRQCVAVRGYRSAVLRADSNEVEERIEIDAGDAAPVTWYVVAARTADGYRIRSADDEATRDAKRLLFAADDVQRAAIVDASASTFAELAAAFASLPLYSADERKAARAAAEFLRPLARSRSDAVSEAALLSALASIRSDDGDIDGAQAVAEEAVRVAATSASRRALDAARLTLGRALLKRDAAAARAPLEDAARSDDMDVATGALFALAYNAMDNFRLNDALIWAGRLQALGERTGSSDAQYRAAFVHGTIYRTLHSDIAARDAFRDALRWAERRHDSAEAGLTVHFLAMQEERLWTTPSRAVARMMDALRRIPCQRTDLRALIAAKAGMRLVYAGYMVEAEALASEEMSIAERIDDPETARETFFFIEQLRKKQKRWREAVDAAQASIDADPASMWTLWAVRADMADSLVRLGRNDEAVRQYQASLDSIEKRKALMPMTPDGGLRYMADKVWIYRTYAMLLISMGRVEEAFTTIERMRSYALTEAMGGRALPAVEMNDVRRSELERRLVNLNRVRLVVRDAAAKAIQRQQDLARGELERVRSELALRGDHAGGTSDEWARALDLRGVLPDDTAIVEYVVDDCQIAILVISQRGGELVVRTALVEIDSWNVWHDVERLRTRMGQRDLSYRAAAREMEKYLLRPVEAFLQPFDKIYIVPDAFLWRVPFAILRDRSGKMLIERHTLTYAVSVFALRAAARLPPRSHSKNRDLLALGDPVIGRPLAHRIETRYRGVSLGELPDAANEVRALKRMYGDRAAVFVGSDAREVVAKRLAPSYRVLHFATHGVMDDEDGMFSALVLAPSQGAGNDGLLEAREVAAMHLTADLAILSACDTAVGTVYNGQGIIGIAWAFLIAGCPTTVVSQWEVASRSTSPLMIEFHRQLLAHKPPAEALRQAALLLRRNPRYSHPYYWAPFVVMGKGW